MTEQQLYKIYRRRFVQIYADFVALQQDKPAQILIEESNIISHLAQSHDANLSPRVRQENIDKAASHLFRATLDLHKLVWANLVSQLSPLVNDKRYLICFNLTEGEALRRYGQFTNASRKARRLEMTCVGVSPLRSMAVYGKCIDIGFALLEAFDPAKRASLDGWFTRYKVREYAIGFGLGCFGSWIAGHFPLLQQLKDALQGSNQTSK